MAILDFKAIAIEPLAPNQDAVRDVVNPLGGLKMVAQGLDSLNQLYTYDAGLWMHKPFI